MLKEVVMLDFINFTIVELFCVLKEEMLLKKTNQVILPLLQSPLVLTRIGESSELTCL